MPTRFRKDPLPPRTSFVIHQNAQGYWVASEKGGCVTGIFAVERDALRFALSRLHGGITYNGGARKLR
jgi:hypothetical protein